MEERAQAFLELLTEPKKGDQHRRGGVNFDTPLRIKVPNFQLSNNKFPHHDTTMR